LKHINKKLIFAVACLLLLGVAGSAMAADIVGDVSVIEKQLILSDVTVPSSVNPTDTVQFSFVLSYSAGIGQPPNGLDRFFVDIWHSTTTKTSATGDLHYSVDFIDVGSDPSWKNIGGPAGWLVASDPRLFSDIPLLQTYVLSRDVKFQSVSKPGTWRFAIDCQIKPAAGLPNLYEEVAFTVNQYSSLLIEESSFSWGNVQHGTINAPITDPESGYLTMSIAVNNRYTLQVMGTTPADGATHTFPVSNIKVGMSSDPSLAQSLTTALVDLNTVTFDVEVTTIQMYIWITVPEGTFFATYTTTLSFVLVPA